MGHPRSPPVPRPGIRWRGVSLPESPVVVRSTFTSWLVAGALLWGATACGGDDGDGDGSDGATAPTSTSAGDPATTTPPTSVPDGVTLRVADQYGLFQGVMGRAGLDADLPYDVEYVTLSPGPVQVQAFQAGEVDVGVVSPLGLIQAGAGQVDLHAVARWTTDFALQALVAGAGVTGIDDWEDLAGKRLAFQRNTMGEALALLGLDAAGLTLDDVTVVDIPHAQVGTVLQAGEADAGITSEPFASTFLEGNPTATYVLGIEEPLAQSTIIVASDDALADPALGPAVAEYVDRLRRAFEQLTSDPVAFTDLVIAVWRLDRDYIEGVLDGSEGVRVEAVPGDLVAPFERLVELLAERGDVPADLGIADLFDTRFTALLGA